MMFSVGSTYFTLLCMNLIGYRSKTTIEPLCHSLPFIETTPLPFGSFQSFCISVTFEFLGLQQGFSIPPTLLSWSCCLDLPSFLPSYTNLSFYKGLLMTSPSYWVTLLTWPIRSIPPSLSVIVCTGVITFDLKHKWYVVRDTMYERHLVE